MARTGRFSKGSIIFFGIWMSLYLITLFNGIGYRSDHGLLLLVIFSFYFGSEPTNRFFWGTLGFTLFWMAFDASRIIPNYMVNDVHIKDLYDWEMSWFGMMYEGQKLTPNEWFAYHKHPILDFFSGFFYLMWMPGPIGMSMYFFFKKRKYMAWYTLAFLLTNVIGMTIYYLYPAAPPWYVSLHGFEKNFDIPGSAAGLLAFDELLNINLFYGIYEKSANVFAAVPSLHSAYPVLSVFYACKSKSPVALVFMILVMVWTWFGAVYTNHHYIVDVLLGILCALTALFIFEVIFPKTRMYHIIKKMERYIVNKDR